MQRQFLARDQQDVAPLPARARKLPGLEQSGPLLKQDSLGWL